MALVVQALVSYLATLYMWKAGVGVWDPTAHPGLPLEVLFG
jgi:hypothetical protein